MLFANLVSGNGQPLNCYNNIITTVG